MIDIIDIMAKEVASAVDGPDTRDGYKHVAYNPYGKKDYSSKALSFGDAKTPAETDLLPDDEFETNVKPVQFKNTYDYDIAVIGSGPEAYTASIRAARLGARVILFEKDIWLKEGFIPAKAYLNSEEGAALDFQGMISFRNSIVSKMMAGAARALRACRVRVESGDANLKGMNEIYCRGKVFSAAKIILCGGRKNNHSHISGDLHPGVLTADDIYKESEIPNRLLVLGGGREGCELAAAFASFGSNVMLVEERQSLLPDWDRSISEAVWKALTEIGIKVHTGITVNSIADKNGNPYVITERGALLCDKVLLATGRKYDLSFLGELADEFRFENGMLAVNEFLETSVPGIFATNDTSSFGDQTHISHKMAEAAASNALGKKKTIDLRAAPKVILTKPEAASVGLTEEEARELYDDDVVLGYCPLSGNVWDLFFDTSERFVKVLVHRKYGELLGVHMFGAGAVEMIAEPAAMIRMEVTAHEVVNDIIHVRSTWSEAFAEACADALDEDTRLFREDAVIDGFLVE